MYERNTRTVEVTCRDCKVTFEHRTRSNRPKLLCDTCLKASQRRAARESQRARRATEKFGRAARTCQDCDADISSRRANALRCVPCVKKQRAAYQQQLRDCSPKAATVYFCVTCTAQIDRVGHSGRPRYCAPCKVAARLASSRRTDAKRREARGTTLVTHCSNCEQRFDIPKRRGRHPATCFGCQRQRHYAYMRARTDVRRGAEAHCVDCETVVPLPRKGPSKVWCRDCRTRRKREAWRELSRIYSHMRRAWKLGNGYEKFRPAEIFDRDGWTCGICHRGIKRKLSHPDPWSASLDHILPLSKGGGHLRTNTQAAHLRCNLRKNNKIPKHIQMALIG